MLSIKGNLLLLSCLIATPVTALADDAKIPELMARIAKLEAKLQKVTVDQNNIYIDGANLHIRNGSRSTTRANSTGNLVIGYNSNSNEATGSHNIVMGDRNDFSGSNNLILGSWNKVRGNS